MSHASTLFAGKHALVTGGAGFIGSHIADALVEAGATVTIVDNLSTGFAAFVNPKARFEKIDLLAMTNSLSASLPLDVLEKQSLLECPTIEDRERRLTEFLRFKTVEAQLGMDGSRPSDS